MGQKVKKVVLENAVTTTTDYLTGYQYKNTALQFFPTAEGYVNFTQASKGAAPTDTFNYAFNYVDHLGNVRLTYSQDPVTLALRIMEENHYYAFGFKHSGYNSDQLMYIKDGTTTKIVPIPPLYKTSYNYKFNSRELQDELGLNMYDLGAMGYMPDTGRLTTIDPKSEKYAFQSPFAIAVNNPVFFIDINGEGVDTDYTILTNGEVKRADPNDGSEKNEKDRILKSDGKGNVDTKDVKNADGTTTKTPKVAVDNIAKGIIKEGTNFKNESQIIKIGGEGQPSAKDVREFLVQFSEEIANVEISGFGGSMMGSSQNVMMTEAYKNNSMYESQSAVLGYLDLKSTTQGSLFIEYHFHVHPNASSLMSDNIDEPSPPDYFGKNLRNKVNGDLPHYIYNKNGTIKY